MANTIERAGVRTAGVAELKDVSVAFLSLGHRQIIASGPPWSRWSFKLNPGPNGKASGPSVTILIHLGSNQFYGRTLKKVAKPGRLNQGSEVGKQLSTGKAEQTVHMEVGFELRQCRKQSIRTTKEENIRVSFLTLSEAAAGSAAQGM